MSEASPAVKTVDLHKDYRMGEIVVHALRGVDIEAWREEAVAIMGPSGSGKTTLLNLIGALDKPTKGKVFIDGDDITKFDDNKLTKLRRHKIGFVFQFFNLLPVLTAAENIELPMLIAGIPKNDREKRVKELLELVGLAERANHRPDELSGGEQQRVAIARALANRPAILLADEPTGDLDEVTGQRVVSQMIELTKREKGCLIVVTHDPEVAEKMDRILYIRDGKIIKPT